MCRSVLMEVKFSISKSVFIPLMMLVYDEKAKTTSISDVKVF